MIDLDELGTAAGAVNGYVDMMASAVNVSVERLHCWLDTYYQLRVRYEAGRPLPGHVGIKGDSPGDPGPTPEDEPPADGGGDASSAAAAAPSPQGKAGVLFSGNGARFKRDVYQRLIQARREGITMVELRDSAGKALTDAQILAALQAGKLCRNTWELIDNALKVWEAEQH